MPSEPTSEQPVAEVPTEGPIPERPAEPRPAEIGGRTKGLEPTRYGDWEKGGRCIDF